MASVQAVELSPGLTEPRRSWLLPGALGVATALGTLGIAAADPTDTGRPICLSRVAFGLDCPLCGGIRCVDALAQGDLLAAADHNVALAVVLPLVVAVWAWWMIAAIRHRPLRLPRIPPAAWIVLGLALAAFTVVRNVGGGGWVGWLASGAS